jgi:hypothetical protein
MLEPSIRRMPWSAAAMAALTALTLLSVPAVADANLLDTYQRLAARRLSPAPLVPTEIPRAFQPIDRAPEPGTTIGGRGYAVRLVHQGPAGPDAVIEVSGGEFRSIRALWRERRRQGYESRRRTRIRGRRGYLLTRRLGPLTRELAWEERGVVYTLGSGTPRKVSLRALRSTAAGLDRLERDYFGGAEDPDNSSDAVAVTTTRTVTAIVSFEAKCASPGSTEVSLRVGTVEVTLLRREGDTFSFDIDSHRRGQEPWTGAVMGTISPDAITLDVRATATIEGETCDTGALSLTLDGRTE